MTEKKGKKEVKQFICNQLAGTMKLSSIRPKQIVKETKQISAVQKNMDKLKRNTRQMEEAIFKDLYPSSIKEPISRSFKPVHESFQPLKKEMGLHNEGFMPQSTGTSRFKEGFVPDTSSFKLSGETFSALKGNSGKIKNSLTPLREGKKKLDGTKQISSFLAEGIAVKSKKTAGKKGKTKKKKTGMGSIDDILMSFMGGMPAVQMPDFEGFPESYETISSGCQAQIGDDFLTYTNLRLTPYEVTSIQDMKIEHKRNEPASLYVKAVIDDSVKDDYVNQTSDMSPVGIYFIGEKKPVMIFQGIVTEIQVYFEGDVCMLIIEAKDMVSIMDIYKKSRSFQNINMTSHELVKTVMAEYPDSTTVLNIPNEPIGELVIQYEETDWNFLCRFVSRYHSALFSKKDLNQVSFTAGPVQQEGKLLEEVKSYKIFKDIEGWQYRSAHGVTNNNETDAVCYEMLRSEILSLGQYISWKGQKFYVKTARHEIISQVVKSTYQFVPSGGLAVPRQYNERITGVSIRGVILEVSRDKVKVQMEIDGNTDKSTAYWFPYSTVAASPDGGGWYCMPEVGEEVRVYCPLKDEAKAYAASAIGGQRPDEGGQSAGGDDRMSDPNNKSLKTAQGQEIKFTPDGVLIESNGGESRIKLGIDGNVSVSGQKAIYLTCAETLTMRAETEMLITAQDGIDLLCESEGTVVMDSEIKLSGKNVKNNC